MKIIKILAHVIGIGALALIYFAPVGPLPGFFIGGQETAVPDTWGDTSDVHEIKLKVGGGTLPRVVIIWVVQVDGQMHVVGASDSGWTTRLGEGGPVEMRLGNNTYAMQATRLRENALPILTAYVDKYRADYPDIVAGFPAVDEASENFALFRLTARAGQ